MPEREGRSAFWRMRLPRVLGTKKALGFPSAFLWSNDGQSTVRVALLRLGFGLLDDGIGLEEFESFLKEEV